MSVSQLEFLDSKFGSHSHKSTQSSAIDDENPGKPVPFPFMPTNI